MRRDHEAALYAALDQLFLQGSTSILWAHLYLWYNADRISKRVYTDIIDRWMALCEEYGYTSDTPDLYQLTYADTWFTIRRDKFHDEELTPVAEFT